MHEYEGQFVLDVCFLTADSGPMRLRTHTPTTTRTVLDAVRDDLRERRDARASYRHLKRELASYRTPSDIEDVLAAMDRQDDTPDAELIRGILTGNLSAYRRRQRIAS